MVIKIGVVGAGIVASATSVNIQTEFPEAEVTMIADKWGSETTSYGPGGLSRPSIEHMEGDDANRIKKWFLDSFEEYERLVRSGEGGHNGIYPVSGYMFSDIPNDPLYKNIVYSFRELTSTEMSKLAPLNNNKRYGYMMTTIMSEGGRYMKYLQQRFQEKGGRFEKRHLNSLEELVGRFDVVVNCCGIGARELVADLKVYPRRGQIIKVHAPWIKHFVYAADDTYIFPTIDSVTLGSVSQRDNYNLELDQSDSDGIYERCCRIMPSLKNAPVVGEWVGLRPHRDPIRLEKEVMTFETGIIKVVHNYGHGRYGICLSWGSGIEAARKVAEFIREMPLTSKL